MPAIQLRYLTIRWHSWGQVQSPKDQKFCLVRGEFPAQPAGDVQFESRETRRMPNREGMVRIIGNEQNIS